MPERLQLGQRQSTLRCLPLLLLVLNRSQLGLVEVKLGFQAADDLILRHDPVLQVRDVGFSFGELCCELDAMLLSLLSFGRLLFAQCDGLAQLLPQLKRLSVQRIYFRQRCAFMDCGALVSRKREVVTRTVKGLLPIRVGLVRAVNTRLVVSLAFFRSDLVVPNCKPVFTESLPRRRCLTVHPIGCLIAVLAVKHLFV